MYGCIKYSIGETPVEAGWPVHSIVSEVYFVGEATTVYLFNSGCPSTCMTAYHPRCRCQITIT